MAIVILSIHLIVCLCLIGLVLLQRSEGGALGMGGGGGSLMSGRGAADALARMTSVAGGFFLVTSLGLTMLSGAAASSDGRSVLERAPVEAAPSVTPPPAQAPDPAEAAIEPATEVASLGETPTTASPPAPGSAERAAPLGPAPAAALPSRNNPPPAQTAAVRPQPAAPQRATAPAATPPQRPSPPAQNGAISGIVLEDATTAPESTETGNGLGAVRRDRAGPDQ